MPATLITNIKQLVNVRAQTPVLRGKQLAELPCIENAYLVIEDDTIAGYGPMHALRPFDKLRAGEAQADNIPPPHPNYPTGEFEINKTRVVFAAAGTALLAEAEHFGISYGRLLEFNDLKDGEILQKDQLLYLQRKRKTGANETHVVVPGETAYDICQAEGMRLESLLEYNQLDPGMQPAAGETLYLRGKAPARPMLAQAALRPFDKLRTGLAQGDSRPTAADGITTASDTTHIVQPKETLYSISKKYGVSLEQLKNWNKLDTLGLKTGQQLVIHKN
jgi:LysM repeat protein